MRWKKIMAWVGGGMAAVILLAIFGAFLIQQNTFVHRYLLAKMIQIGERSAGTQIAIRDYSIRWIPLQITLRDVVVRGTESDLARPLASLPEVEIGISWAALLHKNVKLTELLLDRPAVNFAIDRAGESNLPARPASAPSTSKLQISVQHAAVRGGELRYNNLPRQIDADLADFHLDVKRGATADQYAGTLEYNKGEIAVDGYAPLRHDAQISFAATRAGITFDRIQVDTELSQLNAKGSIDDYSNPVVQADYQMRLSTIDLTRELRETALSGGEIELAGSLSYQTAAGPPLEALKTNGRVSSKALRASVSKRELNLRSLTGDYSLEGGNLHVTGFRTETMGGVVHAEFSAEGLTAIPRYQLAVSAESLSLEQAEHAAGAGMIPLGGTAHIQASAHWTSSIQNAMARADAGISGFIGAAPPTSNHAAAIAAESLPFHADLHIAYDAPQSTLTVTNSSVSSNQTSIVATGVVATGTISNHSALSLHAQTSDLHEADLLIESARSILSATEKTASSASTPLHPRGRASLDAEIHGRIQDPRITGHAVADALEIRQARWPHIQADFDVSASSVSLQNGLAQSVNHGQLTFALATNLQDWSYSANSPITAHVQASQIPVSDFEQITGLSAPISGMFSGNLSIRSTIDNPAGEGSLELRNASLWGEPVRSIAAQVHAANKTVSASISIAAPAGNISGEGEFGVTDGHYQISISHSVLNLGQIHYLSSRGYSVAGTLGIDAQGQGTWKAPQVNVALDGEQLAVRATPFGSMKAEIHVANQQANFAVTSNIAGGQILANGSAGLAAPYVVHGDFEIHSLEFEPLLATYMRSARNGLRGNTEVRGQIDGPLAHPEEVKANVELSTLNLTYQNLSFASAGPVRLNYADNALTISHAELKGTGTDFQFGGTLPLRGSAPLNVTTTGSIDLRLLTILGRNTQSSGTVKIDMAARGALKQPQIGGTIELTGASFASDVAPIGVEDVNARIAVANHRLTIETFSGQMGGGTFSVSGFAGYAPVSFSLQVNGKSVRVRYPQGTRAQLDAGLTFSGTAAKSVLNGRVTIDELSFTPDFDLANFVGQFNSSAPSAPPSWAKITRLDVAVASGDVLALSSGQLSLQGSADLRVTGTLGSPVVLGRTTLSGGSLIFMGNVYQVQSGTVVFANPIRTEPTVNLYVTTLVEDYNITLNFIGTLDRLRTNYTSDPALPAVDIIHLLAFGKTTEEAAATGTTASVGAESVIANGLAGQVSNRIEKLTGISQLELDPSLGGNNSDPGARVAIQERIASNMIFTFATDLTDTQNEVVQVKYQTSGRLSFALTRDEYGSYAIEVTTRKTF